MSERPILMSGPLVRATLEDRKTQTRRLLKTAIPPHWQAFAPAEPDGLWTMGFIGPEMVLRCPYGVPGDRLWVRETWVPLVGEDRDGHPNVVYRAHQFDSSAPFVGVDRDGSPREVASWRPSIHMPRWASRLTLEVTGVRVERLQVISEEDARAEGVVPDETERCRGGFGGGQHTSRVSRTEVLSCPLCAGTGYQPNTYRDAFRALWNQINAERATWESNPWVWVVSFARVIP